MGRLNGCLEMDYSWKLTVFPGALSGHDNLHAATSRKGDEYPFGYIFVPFNLCDVVLILLCGRLLIAPNHLRSDLCRVRSSVHHGSTEGGCRRHPESASSC